MSYWKILTIFALILGAILMIRQGYFDYIESHLNWLSCRVTTRGALNMYDVNIHCENFYMHLLNLLYGWNLVNTNTIQRNSPAIDLMYREGNVIVQVSSTNTVAKIQNSLNKLGTEYNGYNFKFVSIARSAEKLRDHQYSIPSGVNITFNPASDIYGIETFLIKINSLSVPEMKVVYEFIKAELNFESDELKLETGLACVINELSTVDLKNSEVVFDTTSFDVNNKITKNKLDLFKSIIEQYDVYYHIVQKIYNEFDLNGNNKSYAVLQTINKEYLQLKVKYSGDSLYQALSMSFKSKLLSSANLKQFHDEDLDLYLDIVLVDAFIRCKIFEKP